MREKMWNLFKNHSEKNNENLITVNEVINFLFSECKNVI